MQTPFEITEERVESHIDKLLDVMDQIRTGRVTILVGQNGTGKSLIRKQLNVRFIYQMGMQRNVVRQISMQARTESRPDLGALSSCMHDSPLSPTSLSTYEMIEHTIGKHEFSKENPYYLVFDEMEIGMSRESVMGILGYMKERIPKWLEQTLGIMVITHSELVVKELSKAFDIDFFDLGYDEINTDMKRWLDREIIPTDFQWLDEWSSKLLRRVEKRSQPIE